jgi:hypothetical protein
LIMTLLQIETSNDRAIFSFGVDLIFEYIKLYIIFDDFRYLKLSIPSKILNILDSVNL